MTKRYQDYMLGFFIGVGLILVDALGGSPILQSLLGLAWVLFIGFCVAVLLLAMGLMAWHR